MSRDGISQDVYGGAAYDSWAETDVGQSYIDSGAFDDYDDRDSGDDYTPTDPQGKDNYYAKSEAHGNMSPEDQETLASYGAAWNAANAEYQKAVAEGRDGSQYKAQMDKAHADAEALRESYGYRGGEDGSEYNVFEVPKQQAPVQAPAQQFTAQVPDFQSLLNSWLATAKKQQELGIDYATEKGVNDLERAEEDAQEQFQTQQNQVDRNEAKALDNQALYAEARGDRGGIGEAQYAQIQATAMENRRAVNSARVKLSTDTARMIADLRAQGEFKKADALLQLTQTYLGQLIDLQKWGAEYTLDVAQFNAQLQQWQAEFEEDARRWNLEFDYTTSTKDQSMLAESGLAALAVGVRPSAAQQAAMGYTDAQIDAELAAFKLAKTAGVKIDSPAPKGDEPGAAFTTLQKLIYEDVPVNQVMTYLIDAGYTPSEAKEIAAEYELNYDDLVAWRKGQKDKEAWDNAEVDQSSLWDLGYGMYSPEGVADLVAAGKIVPYLSGGYIRFRNGSINTGAGDANYAVSGLPDLSQLITGKS